MSEHNPYPLDEVVDTITVTEDVGGPYPRLKHVTLQLIADGSVRWDREAGVQES